MQTENGFILGLPLANDQTRQHIDTDSNNSQPKKPFVIDRLRVEKLAHFSKILYQDPVIRAAVTKAPIS